MNQIELNDVFYAAQDGDNDAFKKLFDAFWDMAYYSCLKYLRNEHDAEDAVQEVFIILHRRIKKMKGPEFLAKGIQYYTLEVCSGYKNRKRISPELITSLEELQDYSFIQKEEFLPEVVLERKELKEQILELVNNLPNKQREVLFNYYFNDFSAKEIAKLLNINVNAVGFNLHKARQKLTALVGSQKNLMLAATPVMTQLFQEEMLQVATPEIKQHLLVIFEEKLLAELIAQSQVGQVIAEQTGQAAFQTAAQSVGASAGLGIKAVAGAVTIAICTSVVIGINNNAQPLPETYAEERPPIVIVIPSADDFLAELREVRTEAELNEFKRKWEIPLSNECIDESGAIYSVSAKTVEDTQFFVGYKSGHDGFSLFWEETIPGRKPPEDLEIVYWMSGLPAAN